MNDRRRGLGRGLGALIPTETTVQRRPTDVFFASPEKETGPASRHHLADDQFADAERGDGDPAHVGPGAADGPAEGLTTRGIGSGTPHGSDLKPVPGAAFAELPVDAIRANPHQPRQQFDEDELLELVHSIQTVGILQPVVVRRVAEQHRDQDDPSGVHGDAHGGAGTEPQYELVMGERRLRATRAAGIDVIPAIIRQTGDEELLRDALLENLHRSQLNPLEEAAAYQQLLHDFDCTHEVLADRIGRSRSQISNTVRLLRLPAAVQLRVASGVLSAGHARALLGLTSPEEMEHLAARIVAEGLSVRTVEELVVLHQDTGPSQRPQRSLPPVDADLEDWAAQVADRLDTRVTIAMGRRKGKLTVEFASKPDLQRILDILT